MRILIAALTFFLMMTYGADLITAMLVAIGTLAVLSGGMRLQDWIESNPIRFEKWYMGAVIVGFVIMAIVYFTK